MKRRAGLALLAVLGGMGLLPVPASASQYGNSPVAVGLPVAGQEAQLLVRRCIESAARVHHLPPAMLLILLQVEDGRLGRVSDNTNATVDIGPMQVNEIWLPKVAAHWGASVPETFVALRDSLCANLEGSAWILRQGIDEAGGDFWQGVGFYHSHSPDHKADYLRKVLHRALRLEEEAGHAAVPPAPAATMALAAAAATLPARN
ncbi:MAG: lytic transglycosylase domain-containing protein [Janthinobacterium lividum]